MSREGDLVLIHVEDKPAFFARIEWIEPDAKPEWFQVGLLVLQVPPVEVTWILRQEYICGAAFTMGGRKVVLEQVVAPARRVTPDQELKSDKGDRKRPVGQKETGKVISLFPQE